MEDRRKPKGRYSAAGEVRNAEVKYRTHTGKLYTVNVVLMAQRNDKTGSCRETRKRGDTWYYDSSLDRTGNKWAVYPIHIQRLLGIALQNSSSGSQAQEASVTGEDSKQPSSCTADGQHGVADQAGLMTLALEECTRALTPEQARLACDMALEPGTDPDRAFRVIRSLVLRHNVQCTKDDARRAALFVGSMAVLQLVLRSDPGVQLIGLNIFDKRYPGRVQVNGDEGRKNCLRALLARGARLGEAGLVPPSKLLRKIEADSFQAWLQRYWRSVSLAGVEVPDYVQEKVKAFLIPRAGHCIEKG